jgi:hypothetical protein
MNNILSELKALSFLILFFIIVSVVPFFSVEAFSLSPFGGRVVSIVPCSCSEGSQVTISGSSRFSGTYLYSSATKLFARRSVSPGGYLIGRYSPGGVCLVGAPPTCTDVGITKGTITFIGTSL